MQINSHLFHAASTLYQALLARPSNLTAQDPHHAVQAKSLADEMYRLANRDPTLTLAAARVYCGFLLNPLSSHASPQELLRHAMTGARSLVDAFAAEAGLLPLPAPKPPWSPPVAPAAPPPEPTLPPPSYGSDVPDFTVD